MGSRLRENVKNLFECFCEIAAPIDDKNAWILQKYPESFNDEEILKSVPKFAYPCEVENTLVQHFSFVLTSIDSKWTFGFCRHDPKTDTALVVLSALPWHEIFYKFLNHIAALTNSSSGENLWKFLETVYNSDIPIPGNSITIPSPDPNITFVCQSPKQFQLPSIPENRNLTEYYSAVDSHNMMMIFASMLYERRIIFTSKRLSRLSACVQACNALIYPMIWQHIYIPVLPLSLMDYLLAPMPFLIGVPAPTFQRVRKTDLGDVVILDADTNSIESPFQDLESLPLDVVIALKKALRNRAALLGDGVSRAFLRALVQLTAGYREALTLQQGERITFDQNAFVESRPASMQPFLRKMLELQIFQQFIEERLNMLNSGLGFSDEFEMEACGYSVKSSNKFMQQYREWTYTMKKEGSAFFRSVKDKANPAVKYAVKSVKDKGKDMKTAYKGLKWKGKATRTDSGMRFHQPRSAPSSPTLNRKSGGFSSPPKSPNGFTATTSYRKELRLRNSNFIDTSRKQYSPLSPSSPEETDFQPQLLDLDLMQELRDVIFPNTPPVDRTLKPVRSLDSLRPAWSGSSRHGALPNTVITDESQTRQVKSLYSSISHSTNNSIPQPFVNYKHGECSKKMDNDDYKLLNFDEFIPPRSTNESQNHDILKTPFSNRNHGTWNNELFAEDDFVDDPFDTSRVFSPNFLQRSIIKPTNLPLPTKARNPLHPPNTASCSAHVKKSPEVPDLIKLDSTSSNEDFDPLLSKPSEFNNAMSKQMTQSLHEPRISEGLSNPLYPYFQPVCKDKESEKSSDTMGDFDLLKAYGIDFNKFRVSNGESSTTLTQPTQEISINNVDDTFSLPVNSSTVKSQNNWTKFE